VSDTVIVIADVAGSTPLYEAEGDVSAMELVTETLDRISDVQRRHGGEFVVSRGDDVHFLFTDACDAFVAAEAVLRDPACHKLPIHYAMHWGTALKGPNNIFGDAVNVAARIAGMANPGEVLMSRAFVNQLPADRQAMLRPLSNFRIKGKSDEVELFALFPRSIVTNESTVIPAAATQQMASAAAGLVLRSDAGYVEAREGEEITIGRIEGSTIQQDNGWVSRRHASIRVRAGLVELTDTSSNGVYLTLDGREEVLIRRQTVLLAGAGVISAGISAESADAVPIKFEVRQK